MGTPDSGENYKKKERSPHRRGALRDKCIRSSKKEVNELQGMSVRISSGTNERTPRKSEWNPKDKCKELLHKWTNSKGKLNDIQRTSVRSSKWTNSRKKWMKSKGQVYKEPLHKWINSKRKVNEIQRTSVRSSKWMNSKRKVNKIQRTSVRSSCTSEWTLREI